MHLHKKPLIKGQKYVRDNVQMGVYYQELIDKTIDLKYLFVLQWRI